MTKSRKRSWLIPLIHILAWLLFFSLPFWLRPSGNHSLHMHRYESSFGNSMWPYLSVMINGLIVPLFYVNTIWIFPRFLSRQQYGLFALLQLIIMLGLYGWTKLSYFLFLGYGHIKPPSVFPIFNYLMITSIAFGIYAVRNNLETERIQKEREHAGLVAELQFLRWQISPHFLFNVLNNLVALARIKSDHLEPTLHRLSNLMRYMVYEADDKKISMEKEWEYLQSYIELQRLRLGSEVTINVHCDLETGRNYRIEPMLLIPFVENAFKHGTGLIEAPLIEVRLRMEGSVLHFEVRNKFIPVPGSQDQVHGVGLSNVQRRLNLLYENGYDLQIQKNARWFTASLTLNLN